MSFKSVPCMPVCAVSGHIRAFGSRSVQPAFSPVTNRNKSEGPCFSFQPPEFHLLYLKRRETWCHKPLLLLAQRSKGQETSVLQANPRELRDAQHGISSVQWFLRARKPKLPPWCSPAPAWNTTLWSPWTRSSWELKPTADGGIRRATQSSSPHLPRREHTPVPEQIQALRNTSWWSPESLHSITDYAHIFRICKIALNDTKAKIWLIIYIRCFSLGLVRNSSQD